MKALALLKKDLSNLIYTFGPAVMLGVPVLLLLQFTTATESETGKVTPLSALWIAFFLASTSLFFRSFSAENHSKNFQVYTTLGTSRLSIFISQSVVHFLGLALLGLIYLGLIQILWSPPADFWIHPAEVLLLLSASLAPLGTVLGLMLQLEREFLFSVIYLPLATPAILAAANLTSAWESGWLKVLVSFLLVIGFSSAFIFRFFFDELSQSS